jgi:hypothetical protein
MFKNVYIVLFNQEKIQLNFVVYKLTMPRSRVISSYIIAAEQKLPALSGVWQ